jgi:hypothetical protein
MHSPQRYPQTSYRPEMLLLAFIWLATCPALLPATVPKLPSSLISGPWRSGHVQGVAVDEAHGYIYYSFTNLLVKTDLRGRVIGTIGGFTGHLGDLDFNETDRRVYGSLEYKAQKAFYIAVVDVEKIDTVGMQAQNSEIFRAVYLPEVVADYVADRNGDGIFDGDTADTPDHRYGCSGIDGVSFGPRFGQASGKRYLTVAYGIYANASRNDNDHQVLLQYDAAQWAKRYARPLDETAPHQSGPSKPDGKYFVYTGNTTYGVQNLEYDESGRRWLMGVYRGTKPSFPNYTLFAIEDAARPVLTELTGTGERGLLLPLAGDGLRDAATGVRGWFQKADVGMASLRGGFFYLAVNSATNGRQTADLSLYRWVGGAGTPFEKVVMPRSVPPRGATP